MIVAIDRALEQLEKHCPLSEPFVIREVSRRRGLGRACLSIGGFIIEITTNVDSITQVDTLIHEWAHCLRYNGRHDDLYGIEWARCYRAVIYNGCDRKFHFKEIN